MAKRKIKSFEEQFRDYVIQSGKTPYWLSKQTGIDHAAIHRFIRDDKSITLRTASKIADVLGLVVQKKDD